jgi:hypothetical protein
MKKTTITIWAYNYHAKFNVEHEQVIDDTRPIQTKKVLGVEVATGASG